MSGPSTNSHPPASPAGNVYHKAERVPRSRVDPVHKLDSAGTLADRRIPDPARAVTLRNLRRTRIYLSTAWIGRKPLTCSRSLAG